MSGSSRTAKEWLGIAAVASLVAVIAISATQLKGLGSSSHGARTLSAPDESILKQEAASFQDNNPTNIEWTTSTRSVANKYAAADIVPGNPDVGVTVIEAKGEFVGLLAKRPPGAPAPTGHYLLVIVDNSNNQLVDVGLLDNHLDLTPLGLVQRSA